MNRPENTDLLTRVRDAVATANFLRVDSDMSTLEQNTIGIVKHHGTIMEELFGVSEGHRAAFNEVDTELDKVIDRAMSAEDKVAKMINIIKTAIGNGEISRDAGWLDSLVPFGLELTESRYFSIDVTVRVFGDVEVPMGYDNEVLSDMLNDNVVLSMHTSCSDIFIDGKRTPVYIDHEGEEWQGIDID